MFPTHEAGKLALWAGFQKWMRYMFHLIEGREFIVEPIHADLFQTMTDIFGQKEQRININVPPRSAKTTLAKYFIAYAWTINPKMNFIYTSYSESLLANISKELMTILEHPAYKAMYPQNRVIEGEQDITPTDDFWYNYLAQFYKGKNIYTSKKITTYEGGICLFSPIGGQITGYGCFSYDTLILTEDGYKKIGEVVENKYNGKVWSYNFKTHEKELQPIYDYVKNGKSKYLKLILDNGEIINCTPDHIFYLHNGQEIRADHLRIGFKIMANFFDLIKRKPQFFHNFFTRVIFIANKFNLFLSKFFKNIIFKCASFISLITNSLSNLSPDLPTFNITNRTIRKLIIFCYLLIWASILCNCNSNFCSNFMKFMIGTIFILHIFFAGSIAKIFKSIVSRIRVKMSNLLGRFSNKGKQNQSMNKQRPILVIFAQIYSHIAFFSRVLFHKLISFCRINFSKFRNIISLIFGYRKIINIIDCNHIAPSYCITLWSNNNFYITKSQVLVHNCGVRGANKFSGALIIDDGNKPADVRSQTMRDKVVRYYEETLLSRLNNPYVPIINIQQRLHIGDLSGILQDKYNFKTLKKPLLDENGGCQIPSQYTPERIKELQINNYMFLAQYQQEPIAEGGNVIKREYFKYYPVSTEFNYRRILISADTAMKVKAHNDYSVFMAGGVTDNNRLHVLDIVRGKWEAPELEKVAVTLWNKWKRNPKTGLLCNGFYIEDKASGIGLVQGLKAKYGIPVFGIKADTDKLTRCENVLPYIESGQVLLPESEIYSFNSDLLAECEAFSRDDSHLHDDQVDALGILIQEALGKTTVSLLDYFM